MVDYEEGAMRLVLDALVEEGGTEDNVGEHAVVDAEEGFMVG